jgi:hypothetical protein
MLLSKTIIYILFFSLFSCDSNSTKANESIKIKLEGIWQSIDDLKYEIEIKENIWTDIYDGKRSESLKIDFGSKCLDEMRVKAKSSGKYITLSGKGLSFCYCIVKLTNLELELSFVGREKTISFKRIK